MHLPPDDSVPDAGAGELGVARDRGVSIIEIVITISLLGLVVAGLLTAVRTTVTASSVAYEGGDAETLLLNAADRVNRAPQLCEYEEYVDAAALAQDWSTSTISSRVELLVDNTGNPAADWITQPCPADVGPFDVQRVVITVTTPENQIIRTLTAVKSSVD